MQHLLERQESHMADVEADDRPLVGEAADLGLYTQQQHATRRSARLYWAGIASLGVLLLASLTLLGWQTSRVSKLGSSTGQLSQGGIPTECLHALGGGLVESGGNLPHAVPDYCQEYLVAYAAPGSGPYWTEVALAAQSAMTAMGLSPPATAELGAAVPAPDAASVFVFDIDETALSNLPHITWNNRDAARAARLAAASPALMPVRELYLGLWRAGYSVAFITGRKEADRNSTALNLKAAGYGSACDGSDGTEVMAPAAAAQAAEGARAAGGEACYVTLTLRPAGDDRLASVYKPWARNQLQEAGYKLLGNIGDQFSDLAGEHSAQYSFKLPNVWYFIL